jgi:CRP-like cAMP-binding protein
MEQLTAYFCRMGFSQANAAAIAACFSLRPLSRGDYFVQEGHIADQIAYVATGMLRYYSLSIEGEERTTYISRPDTFVASLLSYLTGAPAREYICALADTDIWVIHKTDVLALQQQIPAFKDFYITLIEWQVCCIDKSKFDLIALSAEQRYEKIMREEPELIRLVPLQYIASMIGVTPRHLSRLRHKS